jgi:GTP-binding protein
MLVDAVEIEVKAGRGGNGVVSWRREKFVPKGGPDGGDGGRGGDVYLKATHDVDTLSSFRYRKVFQAANGETGQGKKKTGRGGDDLELLLPVGTTVTDVSNGRQIADLNETGQEVLIARGGKGGLGNVHFATATHQRPSESTEGVAGEQRAIKLELKLVADVALVGEPNAGKSSLLKALTGVEARIGEYAFSTTQPLLGVLKLGKKSLTLVDLPGLLEGAHHGKGLGDKFLQHATRVRALLHVVDATVDISNSAAMIERELEQYGPELAAKPRYLVVNKIDLLPSSELAQLKKRFPKAVFTSVLKSKGIDRLLELLAVV